MKQTLNEIFDRLKEKNYRIVAPFKEGDKLFFREVNSPSEIALDYVNPDFSVKEWFFPRTETVMEFKNHLVDNVEITDEEELKACDIQTAIIGVRPCDVKSLLILDKVFSWDYKDDFYLKRRESTVLIPIACKELGEDCFCDKIGIDMDSNEGADILLVESGDNSFDLGVITKKGEELFPEEKMAPKKSTAHDGNTLDLKKIKKWLDNNFENGLWEEIATKCLGCGACAYVCPTCHCFDLVDEASLEEGCRRKNWDGCCFGQFTLHASGHNPRPSQKERYRNRIMHKFKYYEDKFDETACVGCGRCLQVCPVNMNIKSIVGNIEKK